MSEEREARAPLAPWLQRQLDSLLSQRGHAWLLQGPSGLGQYPLGLALVEAWLCDAPTPHGACGHCASCHAVRVRTHPDLMVLMPETALLALGWLDATAPMTLAELFAVHTHREVATLFAATCTHQATAKSQTKAALLQALQPHHTTAQPYRQWHPTSTEAVWRVAQEVTALCTRLRLMFFGNLHQSWSEFVLADLGLFQYEVVPFDAQSRAFQCRADVDHYLALHALRQALDDGAERPPLLAAAVQATSPNPWLERRRAKLLMRLGEACEKAADWPLAEQAYAHSQHPGARHRRIRVHERMGRHADALALALLGAPLAGQGLQVLCEVVLDRQGAEHLDAFETRAVDEPLVQQCWRVSPGPDFLLVVWAPDMPGFQALTQRLFTQDANVRNVKSFFALKRAKFDPRVPVAVLADARAADQDTRR